MSKAIANLYILYVHTPEPTVRLAKSSIVRQDAGSALLSRCRELQEVELVVTYPGNNEINILSSITSTNIRRISLVCLCSAWDFSWRDINWEIFDESLCRLADQLGRTHELEVDFRVDGRAAMHIHEGTGLVVVVDSFARLREKGKLKVVWVGPGGRECVVYPPSHPR